MYTVFRFSGNESCPDETLLALGARLNELVPEAFDGRLDNIGRRFSVNVSNAKDWDSSMADVSAFLDKARPVLDDARTLGVALEISPLIEPEDFGEGVRFQYSLSRELMSRLLDEGIDLDVTYCRAHRTAAEEAGPESA
jgi:hypothetical protein